PLFRSQQHANANGEHHGDKLPPEMRDVFGPDQADAAKHAADDEQPADQEDQPHRSQIRVDQRDYAGDYEKDALEQIPSRITLDRLAHGLAHGGRRLCHCHRHLTVLPKSNPNRFAWRVEDTPTRGGRLRTAVLHIVGGEAGMDQDGAAKSAIGKAARRLLPFLCLCYAVNFLDRVNVGFAALAMNQDIGSTPSIVGASPGILFIGYLLFEVPSNLALQHFGARVWIARIMVSWGLVAMAMAVVSGPASFYAMRFLLGVAEAGFFPGIILYLTYWFPAHEPARIVSLFMAAVPLGTLIGSPVS